MMTERVVIQKCPHELWEGVACELPAGHKGAHHRPATATGAALSWRSSAGALGRDCGPRSVLSQMR